MAIGRITGSVLKSNLTRNGTDLAFETNLLYLDVTNSRVGIGTSEPTTALQVNGTVTATALAVTGSTATINSKEIMVGKSEGTNFTNSLLVGHSTTGTLNSAEHNVGVGISALDALTTGDSNTAVGSQAGTLLTTAEKNSLFGRAAGASLTTGSGNNTGLGYSALWSMNTGAHNIAVGSNSGQNITSGSGNVIIGGVDASSATGSRQLVIAGYDGSSTTTWLTGDSSGNLTTVGDITLANDKKVLLGATTNYITALASSNQVAIYSGQHINLHPTAGSVYLSKTGSVVGSFSVYDEHFTIRNHKNDKDMIFRGNDGGSTINALTLDMSDAGTAIFNHDILPTTDATQDLGSTSKRWNNIYTGDLHLSNESTKSGNSIDGTKGNWTLQEGQSDLFLINNNTGKKYKFKIEEIE